LGKAYTYLSSMLLLLLASVALAGTVTNDLDQTLYDNAYLGCFNPVQLVPGGLQRLTPTNGLMNMTIETCAQMAHDHAFTNKKLNETFFALQNGDNCFATSNLANALQMGHTDDCTNNNRVNCTGNATENCGGRGQNGAIAVWKLGAEMNGPDYWLMIGLPVILGVFGLASTATFAWCCYSKGKVSGQSEYIRHSIA